MLSRRPGRRANFDPDGERNQHGNGGVDGELGGDLQSGFRTDDAGDSVYRTAGVTRDRDGGVRAAIGWTSISHIRRDEP